MSRPSVGDVFLIPTGDGRVGVGQVAGTYGKDAYYFAIFDTVLDAEEAESTASDGLSAPLLLLALSLDAKLHAGHWTVVDREPVAASIHLPAYREVVGTPGNVEVVDYAGDRRREATPLEAETLRERKIVAPVRLERAFRASLGLEPWLDAFDDLLVRGQVSSADIFG